VAPARIRCRADGTGLRRLPAQSLGRKVAGRLPGELPASDQWSTGLDGIRTPARTSSTSRGAPPQNGVGGYRRRGRSRLPDVPAVPDSIPQDVGPATIPKPLDPAVAITSPRWCCSGREVRAMDLLGQPKLTIGPVSVETIQVCAVEDPVCSDGMNFRRTTATSTTQRDRPGSGLRGEPSARWLAVPGVDTRHFGN